jgi:hypothetical protein
MTSSPVREVCVRFSLSAMSRSRNAAGNTPAALLRTSARRPRASMNVPVRRGRPKAPTPFHGRQRRTKDISVATIGTLPSSSSNEAISVILVLSATYLVSPAITYAHSASTSSSVSKSPQGGIWFLPRVTEETKRSCWSREIFRRSNALSGFCIRVPWQGEQLRENISAPARTRSGRKSWAAADLTMITKRAQQARNIHSRTGKVRLCSTGRGAASKATRTSSATMQRSRPIRPGPRS